MATKKSDSAKSTTGGKKAAPAKNDSTKGKIGERFDRRAGGNDRSHESEGEGSARRARRAFNLRTESERQRAARRRRQAEARDARRTAGAQPGDRRSDDDQGEQNDEVFGRQAFQRQFPIVDFFSLQVRAGEKFAGPYSRASIDLNFGGKNSGVNERNHAYRLGLYPSGW